MRILAVTAACLLIFLACYAFYIFGHLTVHSKKAGVFIGNGIGRWNGAATFSVCNGYLKRVIRFDYSRIYNFHLNCSLKCGEILVELQDNEKRMILQLDEKNPTGQVEAKSGEKYYLTIRFHRASGKYKLDWE